MIHAYLILTCSTPEKTNIQVKRLQSGNHCFFIHFDQKLRIDTNDPYYKELAAQTNVVILKKRINVQWGSFRIVEATVGLIREALKHKNVSYLHLLSGECLTVKSASYISNYFERNNGKEFIDNFIMPESSAEHSLTYRRLDKYHFHSYFNPRSPKIKDKLIKNVNSVFRKMQKILKKAGIYRRYSGHYPRLNAGSQWWSLSYGACQYLVTYIDQNPKFYERFKYTQVSDEILFQTIIMNSPFAEKVVNDNLRFLHFGKNGAYAEPLTMEHLGDLKNENVLFARKFTKDSESLLSFLERYIYRQTKQPMH